MARTHDAHFVGQIVVTCSQRIIHTDSSISLEQAMPNIHTISE